MEKVYEGKFNENATSLAQLKAAKVGDEIVVLHDNGAIEWLQILERTGHRGSGFGTTFVFRNLANGETTTRRIVGLPEGVARVRRVSAGFNARTLNKIVAPTPSKVKVEQPEDELDNILDLSLGDEGVTEAIAAPAELAPVAVDTDSVEAPNAPGELTAIAVDGSDQVVDDLSAVG